MIHASAWIQNTKASPSCPVVIRVSIWTLPTKVLGVGHGGLIIVMYRTGTVGKDGLLFILLIIGPVPDLKPFRFYTSPNRSSRFCRVERESSHVGVDGQLPLDDASTQHTARNLGENKT